jgi:hypothetical protein
MNSRRRKRVWVKFIGESWDIAVVTQGMVYDTAGERRIIMENL